MSTRIHINVVLLALIMLCSGLSNAAQRQPAKNDAAVAKLQATVKSLTAERDAAKSEAASIATEVEQLKKDKSTALSSNAELNQALSAQRSSASDLKNRLDATQQQLDDLQAKHKSLNQAKNELAQNLKLLQAQHSETETQFASCKQHNVKLYNSALELLDRYQNKGVVSSLLANEPLLQIESVDMENVVQEYKDKVVANKLVADKP